LPGDGCDQHCVAGQQNGRLPLTGLLAQRLPNRGKPRLFGWSRDAALATDYATWAGMFAAQVGLDFARQLDAEIRGELKPKYRLAAGGRGRYPCLRAIFSWDLTWDLK
jgi:hypothetical protein